KKTHLALQIQPVSYAHLHNKSFVIISAKMLQSGDALVTVEDLIPIRFVRYGNDHDRRLLSRGRQRCQQPPLPFGIPNAQMLITAVELVKLQLHSAFLLRPSTLVQVASEIAWMPGEVCPQALNLQSHKP